MWADNSIFYHIYPLGFCGAEDINHRAEPINRIAKINDWIGQIKKIGANALYLGPVFDSLAHGYDTSDYFKIDKRLGSNEDFKQVCQNLHDNGIKIVLDGVFNHVGREFWAFKDVQQYKGYSKYCDWFSIYWDCNNKYNDGFRYADWEGCDDLVKLNLKNPQVKEHLFHAITTWIQDFDIDGLRLDVAYCLDKDFLKELRTHCKNLKPDFWLMGETLHGDYNQWMNGEMLDSVTNYECYKGLFSSCNSKNMFEIAHSIKRQNSLYNSQKMYTFLDNHDVSRISSALTDKRDLKLIYTLLFAMPGIPSIYYGSEWGIEGDKKWGDHSLRPNLDSLCENDLSNFVPYLSKLRAEHFSLKNGAYKEIALTNEAFSFARETEHEQSICAINIGEKDFGFNYNGRHINLQPKSAQIYINNECLLSVCG